MTPSSVRDHTQYMTAATRTAYLLASTGTRTTHAIIAGAALPGDFATAACGTYAEAGRTTLDSFTAAELDASPTFCRRCAKAIAATWKQDDLDGYTVTSAYYCDTCRAHFTGADAIIHMGSKCHARDGFDAWQADHGMPATRPVDGIETIADYALAVEHAAHLAAGDGRLF